MSHPLVSHSPDLTQLEQEQYDIEIRNTNLLVHHVPYITENGEVSHGILVSELTTSGERTDRPGRHEIWLVGGIPYDHQGNRVSIINDDNPHDFGEGLIAACSMSGKPNGDHPENYYIKVSNYVRILGNYARAIDSSATHTDFPVRERTEEESVFLYHDAATSRSGLSAVTAKLKVSKLAIVGLGGTGSYILDLVAKTPVGEIHLFDDDVLLAHNAFRTPGAASFSELERKPKKVDYLSGKYSAMRRKIVAHPQKISHDNVDELQDMDFVFIAADGGSHTKTIVEALESWSVPFVECGMGVPRQGNSLRGTLRVTTGAPGHYAHIPGRVPFTDQEEDEYDWNVQTADLNMMNAAMAVIRWKKHFGYYVDDKHEFNSTYTVPRNQMISGDLAS